MITIEENVPLAPFTSFEIGGPARYLATATTVAQLREALLFARTQRVPFAILGGGSNLLVSDAGFPGIIIRLKMNGVEITGCDIEAEAGVDFTGLVHRTAQLGLTGMESLAGIPGQLGGAVRGNAGAYGSSTGELTAKVTALDTETLEPVTLERAACGFSYRNSRFKKERRLVVVSARLSLAQGDPDLARQKVEATLAKRHARNLQCERSAGSFFMNPVVGDQELIRRFEENQKVRCRENRIPAGWLIDQAGLRNTRVGAAMVSGVHANYLVNSGGASALEIMELAALVKQKVRETMGVDLQEEVSCLGFAAA